MDLGVSVFDQNVALVAVAACCGMLTGIRNCAAYNLHQPTSVGLRMSRAYLISLNKTLRL